MIDPKAKIHLKWSTDKDINWRKDFEDEGVYVVSGSDFIRPAQASREYGIYQRDLDGNVINLAAPVWNWGTYYELIARNVLEGTWDAAGQAAEDRSTNYWWGMSAEVIDVICSKYLPIGTARLVELLKETIRSDTFNPFSGVLYSQKGIVQKDEKKVLEPEEIITMNWLAENVIGQLPDIQQLTDKAKPLVTVQGINGGNQ